MSIFRHIIIALTFAFPFVSLSAAETIGDSMPNVLLFTIDACRPDHFGCYGYSRNTTPNIDKLAREGALFTHAFSQSAWTTPGMISIFTSLFPPTHGVDAKTCTLKDDVVTLPKILKEHGYAAPVLPRFVDIPNYWHLGFDVVDKERFQGVEGEDLLKLLEAYKDRRFFVWYHYHGLHLPYNPQKPYDTIFRNDVAGGAPAETEAVALVKAKSVIRNGSVRFTGAEEKAVVALYDGQIRQMDDYVGQLTQQMKQWGILDNTVIIMTSDHGEELFEHGFIGHASTSLNAKLYDEVIRIPLIVVWPKKLTHKVVHSQVHQIDIMPTILDLLGLSIPGGLQGNSLLSLMKDNAVRDSRSVPAQGGRKMVFCETILGGFQSTKEMEEIRLRCVRTNEWKLIYTNASPDGLSGDRYELYDLKNDSKEAKNVIERYPAVAGELRQKLFQWINDTRREAR